MRHVILLFLTFFILSCKNDAKSSDPSIVANTAAILSAPPTDPEKLQIPSACEIITMEKLQEILKLKDKSLFLKEANAPDDTKNKSCFFKWDDTNTPNAGILIQIQTNPIFSDYPEYVTNYVKAKITDGETIMGEDQPTKYNPFKVGDINGAYSFKQSRFYWNLGNNYLFMLAFNVSTLSEEKMVAAAEEIVQEINNNFAAKVKQ